MRNLGVGRRNYHLALAGMNEGAHLNDGGRRAGIALLKAAAAYFPGCQNSCCRQWSCFARNCGRIPCDLPPPRPKPPPRPPRAPPLDAIATIESADDAWKDRRFDWGSRGSLDVASQEDRVRCL